MGMIQALFSMDNQLLPLLLCLVALGVAYLTFRQSRPSHIARERMNKVVSPLFELLEPVMCRPEIGRPIGTLRAVLSIISRGAYLSGGRLWEYRDKTDIVPESKDAQQLSLLVSQEYDSLCKALGVPLRTIAYRKRTYKTNFFLREVGQKVKEGLLSTLSVLCMAFVLLQICMRTVWSTLDKDSVSAIMRNHFVAAAVVSVAIAFVLWLLLNKASRRGSTE